MIQNYWERDCCVEGSCVLDKTPFWSKTNRDHIQSNHHLERSGLQYKGVSSIRLPHSVLTRFESKVYCPSSWQPFMTMLDKCMQLCPRILSCTLLSLMLQVLSIQPLQNSCLQKSFIWISGVCKLHCM